MEGKMNRSAPRRTSPASFHLYRGCLAFLILVFPSSPRAQDLKYGTGNWDVEVYGNHRAVLHVPVASEAVWAHIPWRRVDAEPERKKVIIVAGDGSRVANQLVVNATRFYGDLVFEASRAGEYYVYYMPFASKGRNYPVVTYQSPEAGAEAGWKARTQKALLRSDQKLPQAAMVEMQSIDSFNSFFPMEIPATPEETDRVILAQPGSKFLIFPEDRSNPIRMKDSIPQKWIAGGLKPILEGRAERGEFYSFQAGLFACEEDVLVRKVVFSDLQQDSGPYRIPAAAFKSFNTGGINWDGTPFTKKLFVKKGQVQPLWMGVQVPTEASPGSYRGRVTIETGGTAAQSLEILLEISESTRPDSGDDEPWRHSRLRWLDSRLAQDDEIVRPFTPVKALGNQIQVLGRSVTLGPSGLPARIHSFFSPEVTRIVETPAVLLAGPMDVIVEDREGRRLSWTYSSPVITRQNEGVAEWRSGGAAGTLKLEFHGVTEFDGFMAYKLTLSTSQSLEVGDVRLEIPLRKEAAKYMMGLGMKGGFRPSSYDWKWDVRKNQDGAWLGDSNLGLQFSLRAENYSRPLNTNFYQSKPLNLPPSWSNDGNGGINLRENGEIVVLRCYSGARRIEPGHPLHFDFNLLLTPFKPLDTSFQWQNRFFHSFRPVDEVVRAGANVINVHHANEVNPYINYPFLHQSQLKQYVEEAHHQGMKVKIYYTIRELSNHAPELFALRSLGNEIFSEGPGGGFSWLQEHLVSNYIAAWFVPQLKDAAIINSGMSRWHNYYIEGLSWLARKMQIDGIYLDDVAFDRTTMKRIRKVLDRERQDAIIDLHSANQYNERDGFTNSANLYLEHFPYLNRLWFGEYFNPDSPPDFWFVEMSGIPFGLMGEMLQDGGNRWRGALYGMTSRMPYSGSDPSSVWKIWDEFDIKHSEMIGYWSPRCPVRTGREDVLASAFVGKGKTLISIASWAKTDVQVRLTIDWKTLGLDPGSAELAAPESKDFQPVARFKPGDSIPVARGKGWLFIVSGQPGNQGRP